MRILNYSDRVKYMQEGGPAPVPQGAAPAPQGGGEEQMMQQLQQMAMQIIQQMGPDGAAMLAQMIMEMLQGAQQEVGAAPQEEQAFMRQGGKIKKVSKGCKVAKACAGKKLK